MSSEVFWLYEVAVRPGKGDALRDLMAELVLSARSESGTITYQWAIDEDGTVAHIYERYADSPSTLAHLAVFRERFAQRFLDAVDPTRLILYGAPDHEIKRALAALRPVFMSPLAGFDRHDVLIADA
jgi:quinol monooxygenase YgiN